MKHQVRVRTQTNQHSISNKMLLIPMSLWILFIISILFKASLIDLDQFCLSGL